MGLSPPLENTWAIPDGLWEKIEPLLLTADPPKATGRKRIDQRRLLNGIVFKLRTGRQWNRLPEELGDDSTIHRTFQRWVRLGVFAQVWAVLEENGGLGGASKDGEGLTAPTESLETKRTKTPGGHRRRSG